MLCGSPVASTAACAEPGGSGAPAYSLCRMSLLMVLLYITLTLMAKHKNYGRC